MVKILEWYTFLCTATTWSYLLTNKQTACLAQEACGIPDSKPKVRLSDLQKETSCCTPDSGCC